MCRIAVATIFLVLATLIPTASGTAQTVVIATVTDGPSPLWGQFRDVFEQEITGLLGAKYDLLFPDDCQIAADWSVASVQRANKSLLDNPKVDFIVTVGTMASTDIANRGPLPRPALAPFVIAPEQTGLPYSQGASGTRNLCYLRVPLTVERDINALRELVPVEKLGVLVGQVFLDSIPVIAGNAQNTIRAMGIEPVLVPITEDIESSLAAIPGDVDAVYVSPLPHLREDGVRLLADKLIARGLPSFTMAGVDYVRQGILATVTPESDVERRARRVALYIQRILMGEDPQDLPVAFEQHERLTVNMETARAIQVYPKWDVLTEAVLLNENAPDQNARHLTLGDVAHKVVEANLELLARDQAVRAGREDIRSALARLRPQLEAAGAYVRIDEDRAAASMGAQAEQTLTGSLTLSQVLFSEPAQADLFVQRRLQEQREYSREQLRLDLVNTAAQTYLNILQAQTALRIERDNLEMTRSHLDLARIRQSVGFSGPADVYRWESEVARNRDAVVKAEARLSAARIALNVLIDRPLEEDFTLAETELQDPALIFNDPRLAEHIDNPWSFRQFRDFMVDQGLERSPELRQLDTAIQARERGLESVRRQYYLPTVVLQAEVTETFDRAGAGTGGSPLSGIMPQTDDTAWNVGLSASIPLFSGGARKADRQRASATVRELELRRKHAEAQVAQRIRAALHFASASYVSIKQTRQSAQSASKNLELVRDSYKRGAVPLVELLDAQTAAFVADQMASSSVYRFLNDLMEVERAVGAFGLFTPEATREEWTRALDAWLDQRQGHEEK